MRHAAQSSRTVPQPPALPSGRAALRSFERRTRGITLLELLVVMLILLMVTAAAIPIIAPALKNRQMRESSRLVTSFLGAAKARAVQTGRPVGVMIERFDGLPFAFQMSQVEAPPPYSGDIVGSKCTVADGSGALSPLTGQRCIDAGWPHVRWFTVTINSAECNPRLIKVGDTIQLGGSGHLYTIFGPDEPAGPIPADGIVDNTTLEVAYVSQTNFTGQIVFPWLNTAPAPQPVTYQIFRQPVRTSSPPLTLPDGIVIDLVCSGVGIQGSFMSTELSFNEVTINLPANKLTLSDTLTPPLPLPVVTFDPMILFSPSGRVELVTANSTGQLTRPTGAIFLLLGRRELMPDATARGSTTAVRQDVVAQNLSPISPDPNTIVPPPSESIWIAISQQTGQVTTAEMAPNVQDYNLTTPPSNSLSYIITEALDNGRAFARDAQSLGGR